jgi:hypothetical protein
MDMRLPVFGPDLAFTMLPFLLWPPSSLVAVAEDLSSRLICDMHQETALSGHLLGFQPKIHWTNFFCLSFFLSFFFFFFFAYLQLFV